MVGREILVYLSIKYQGDWEKIYDAVKRREKIDIDEAKIKIQQVKSKYVTCIDDDYPKSFSQTYHPPFCLFYYGNLELLDEKKYQRLGVVGTRKPSNYGSEVTKFFCERLASSFVIVSGLAAGIDAIALNTAIESGGSVVAILGSGIENCYPKENISLYNSIRGSHLLISEYPLDTAPNSFQFPLRNRLIASISNAILVTEAKARSGTLITVGHALAIGRDIFCVPHRVGESVSTNGLIRDGAFLAESPNDILKHFNFTVESSGSES